MANVQNGAFHSRKFATKSRLALCCAGITTALYAAALSAAGLEEVVVEAQRKTETISETPISIQAITGDQFQKYASFNFQDLSRTTPGLAFESGVTSDIHLRGVTNVTLAGVSLRTNIYQDGALIEQPRALFDAQFDIERFEVLKGAQGTLYGKSSPTGTINIRTKNPNLMEMDGYTSMSFGQYNTFNSQFGLSLPIIPGQLGVRLAAVYDENQATNQKDVTTGRTAQSRATGARIVVLWEPSNDTTVRLSYHYREKKDNPFYTIDGDGYRYYNDKLIANVTDLNKVRDQLAVLEVTQVLNDHLTLISVTGYEDQDYHNVQDIDGSATPLNPAELPNGDVQTTFIPLRPQIQEDLRLASEDNPFWDWQIGGYYHRETTRTVVNDQRTQITLGVPFSVDVLTTPILTSEEFAVYTHNTFKFTDSFSGIIGLRYQQARAVSHEPTDAYLLLSGMRINITQPSVFGPALLNPQAIPLTLSHQTFYPVTGTAKLQYFITPDWMSYLTIDRAFRTGAPNLNLQNNLPAEFANIESEGANSVEVGLKGTFWHQRARFSSALYHQVYQNFQQDIQNVLVYDPLQGTSYLSNGVVNAKRAEVNGLETELNLLLQDNWQVGFSLALTDSKYKDFKNNPCANPDPALINQQNPYVPCDLGGDRLPLSPRWAGTLSSDYSLPVFGDTNWYVSTLINFQSSQIDKNTRETLGGYATVDLFTGLRGGADEDHTWDAQLWAKNVFNRRVITRYFRPGQVDPATGESFSMVTTNLPRQVGITGTYHF